MTVVDPGALRWWMDTLDEFEAIYLAVFKPRGYDKSAALQVYYIVEGLAALRGEEEEPPTWQ